MFTFVDTQYCSAIILIVEASSYTEVVLNFVLAISIKFIFTATIIQESCNFHLSSNYRLIGPELDSLVWRTKLLFGTTVSAAPFTETTLSLYNQ